MKIDLPKATIFLGVTGSHAYGTATEASDTDVRGLAVAPASYYLGCEPSAFEQAEKMPPEYYDALGLEKYRETTDSSLMEVRKFCKLAAGANPNVLELLFLPGDCWLFSQPAFEILFDARDAFLSQRVTQTFSGYAHSQIKRMRSHRGYLFDRPDHQPTRAEHGLPEGHGVIAKEQLGIINAKIRKLEDGMGGAGLDKAEVAEVEEAMIKNACFDLAVDMNLMPVIQKERAFARACREWKAYQDHLADRNPARAALEAAHGYDTKHGAHVVRLMRMGRECMETGKLVVDRRKAGDADELLAIRRGAWTYDRLMEVATEEEAKMRALYGAEKCRLPWGPDWEEISETCQIAVMAALESDIVSFAERVCR